MKLTVTLEAVRTSRNNTKIWVTTCLCDGFALDEDDEVVYDAIVQYLETIGYRDRKTGKQTEEEYWAAIDLSVNHIQGAWEATVVTSDRLYLRMH